MASQSARRRIRFGQACILALACLAMLTGCVGNARVTYVRQDAVQAQVAGFNNIRTYLDASPTELAGVKGWEPPATAKKLDYLVISGGGSGGAFSVGVLDAWTKLGTRPKFDIVSGVSTGALIAPFAFLGSSYDPPLVKLYTSGVASDLVDRRWLPNAILGKSLLKQEPLRRMVEEYITADVMRAVATEHKAGRRLLVLTSNLDSQRPVVWNMGAIAASGQPDALKLFQDVLIASASVPGVYPAVMIKTHVGNRSFQEMHSDGGSASQVLTIPDAVLAEADGHPPKKPRDFNVYVLINNALMPEFSNTADSTLPVMARAYAMLIKSQTRASVMAFYEYAMRTGINFHLASIDRQYAYSMSDPFNATYMRSIFELGSSEMLAGKLWKQKPIFSAEQPTVVATN
ncbi:MULTISPECIES: patatin-like phospholipase family protein [unclassified Rhizobium]|uniref:patatin-like phospholipase family protein n=1 Tax=unclassified Rhizobium TaxID=2613769 RepID=UPI0027DE420D|nr:MULTISPECIES: patatin-like phospholipase family protein [unclassified Rhizobium]